MTTVQGSATSPGNRWLLIIDRYLLRQFLWTFVICFCSLFGLYVVIDAMANLEEFITYAQKPMGDSQQPTGLLTVLGKYYIYRPLPFLDTTSALLTLISAMFTVTWIQRHNEMTALEAAGIRKARVIKPVILAVVAIVLASAANREFAIPLVRDQLSHNAQDLGGGTGKPLVPRYDIETDVLLGSSGSKTFADRQRISRPDFYLPPGLDRYGRRLIAENAFYQPPRDGRPGGYRFENIEQPKGLENQASLSAGDRAILLTPRDHGWLKPGECFVASNVTFEHLENATGWWQFASTAELIRGLRNRSLDFGANERLAIHARIVQPVLDVTLLFLGLPLVLSRSNRNVFVAIGQCLAVVVAFMLVILCCKYLGASYWLEPALAAWAPLMIFVPCAVAIAQPLRE